MENFFAWWKRPYKVYHLFARSKNGSMVQILSGLITYLLKLSTAERNTENLFLFNVYDSSATRSERKQRSKLWRNKWCKIGNEESASKD
jgi:hypothetical protein